MPNLIIASGDSDLVGSLTGALAETRRDVDVMSTVEGDVAMQRVAEGAVDVAVVDLRLPGTCDAVKVALGAASRSPLTRLLVVDPNHEADVARTTSGAMTWAGVATPVSDLVVALEALVDRTDAYRESLRDLTFQDVLTLVTAAEWTGELFSRIGATRGSVAVRHGDVIDALFGEATGMDALVQLVAGDDGSLLLGPLADDRERVIESDADETLRVAFQRAHEHRRQTGAQSAIDITDDDLDAFMEMEPERGLDNEAWDLFSPDELKELELDDSMVVAIAPTRLTSAGEIEVEPADVIAVVEDIDTVLERLHAELEQVLFVAAVNLDDGEVLGFVAPAEQWDARRPAIDDVMGSIAALRSVAGGRRSTFRECTVNGTGFQLVACGVADAPVAVVAALEAASNPALARALVRRAAAGIAPDLPAPESA